MRLERKLESWFWFLVKIFPILMILFVFISIKVTEPAHFATFEMAIEYVMSFPFFTNVLYPILTFFTEYLPMEDGTNWYLIVCIGMFNHALLVEIFRIIFDLLVILPRVARNLMNRLVGHNEKI